MRASDFRIGDWIARRSSHTAHLVESIISGDAITRCGRRMADEPNTGGELVHRTGRDFCKRCKPATGNAG